MARTPPADGSTASTAFSRRRLLAVSVLGAMAASGCSLSNPAVNEPPTPSGAAPPSSANPSPTARPSKPADSTLAKAASAEQGLANLASAIGRRKSLSKSQRTMLAFLVAAHTEHARALASPNPTLRPGDPVSIPAARASIAGLSTKQALKNLAAAESRIAASHRREAVDARGLTALVWGSLAVAAETFAAVSATKPPPVSPLRKHRPTSLVSDVQATQAMLAQLHAIIYGYQLAIGKLPVVSKTRAKALARLRQHRILRDRLIGWLISRSARVPAPEPAYVPSVTPTNAKTATKLLRQMETALQPFCGLWLAAAGRDSDRKLALTTLRSVTRSARGWGAGVRGWPGWSD